MPNPHRVHMTHGDPGTNRVTLPGGDVCFVKQGDSVSWDISGSNIEHFRIQAKNPAINIFTTPIPGNMDPTLNLQVSPTAPVGHWRYSIFWRQAGDPPSPGRPHDPVIAVRPSTIISIPAFLIVIATAMLSLIAITLFTEKRKHRNKHHHEKEK